VIELTHVSKQFLSDQGITQAIGNISMAIAQGEFVSVVGPSGCGKSTLLNMIAGFVAPTQGHIRIANETIERRLHPSLGYIFQKDTLLPWYTVEKNIALGMRFNKMASSTIQQRVAQLIALGGLEGFEQAYPYQLSGGMRRRLALLMSLAVEPKILLLDEPFGALDTHTKTRLHGELMRIWRQLGQTVVMVTHDLDEAITLSDRVIVLSTPPSTILLEEAISLSRPRDVYALRKSPAFAEHYQKIWNILGQQFKLAL